MKQKGHQFDIQFVGDGGAFCNAKIPYVKATPKIQCSFCYLHFCQCCEGCVQLHTTTETIVFYARVNSQRHQVLLQSKPLTQQEIFRQKIKIINDKDGYVEIQVIDEETQELTQVLARSQKIFILSDRSKLRYDQTQNQLYIHKKQGHRVKRVKMLSI